MPTAAPDEFIVFPAIDLRGGKVVRLAQGELARETVYSDDPGATAERWRAAGARWVHVVNLDGAFSPTGHATAANAVALTRILRSGLKVQFGGGLRHQDSLARAFDAGVSRAVVGTAAIEDPALVDWALAAYGPERLAAGLDARDGQVRLRGWVEETPLTAEAAGQSLAAQGLRWCVFTDIARDGVGTGLNLAATAQLAAATGLRVIASGGVDSLPDIRGARRAGLPGVIVGRALYEGRVDLTAALAE